MVKKILSEDVFVIIPARNESKRIGHVIRNLIEYTKNIIVVDDGSNDKTSEVSESAGAKVIKHIVNMGKGAAAKTGCDYAIKSGADILVLMDADGQHKPKDVIRLVAELKDKHLDIVLGARKLNKNMPGILKFGNMMLNKITSIFHGIDVRDTQSGFRTFTKYAYQKIRWESNDYSMESEMLSKIAKNNLKYAEIPIQTIYLDRYKGTTLLNGLKIGFETIMWGLKR
ncbi:MAG: glycosyltransferase family 2 protein [Candidatus Woesearchaeota archaeon]